MSVQIVLLKKVEKLGKAGDVVKVKEGYARNFLLAYSYAKLATQKAIEEAEKIKEERIKQEQEMKREAEKLAKEIEKISLKLERKEKEGKLFGSVSQKDIAKGLQGKKIEIDKKQVLIENPIKEIGDYEVRIELFEEVKPILKLKIEAEKPKKAEK
ncbi:MAG: 50S ribosomal protein L9 [Candidatus Moranbacteria bacterium]|nr:50S ribosomal protein L9 [Candidatus Moranbacteria bacterium]